MRVPFAKMSGAGNDFVLIETKEARGKGLPGLVRRLTDRRNGVGADGLLLMEKGSIPRLRYFNSDGTTSFCGNGTRCAAWWAYSKGWTKGRKAFTLDTSEGALAVRIAGPGRAAVRMPRPRGPRLGLALEALGRKWTVHFIDTGVPHAVVAVKDVAKAPVIELGRALRRHKAFAPRGVNVDFVRWRPGGLDLRTYERGVEDETLACGTGAAAAAVAAFLLGRGGSPARVRVRSGDELTVSFRGRPLPDEVWLEGPARIVFTGEVSL